jgi:hypothetical protein
LQPGDKKPVSSVAWDEIVQLEHRLNTRITMGSVAIGEDSSGNLATGNSLAIGDSDTGLKGVTDGVLALFTNNTERLRVDEGGNVGIGTNDPQRKFHIVFNRNNYPESDYKWPDSPGQQFVLEDASGTANWTTMRIGNQLVDGTTSNVALWTKNYKSNMNMSDANGRLRIGANPFTSDPIKAAAEKVSLDLNVDKNGAEGNFTFSQGDVIIKDLSGSFASAKVCVTGEGKLFTCN